MTTRYKNLKLTSVNYGFGWRYDGDMSTHSIGNVLEDLDYKFRTLTNNCIKYQNENEELRNIIKELIEATEYGVTQWQKAYSPNSETNAQKVIKKAKKYVTKSTQKDEVGAESNTGEE